MISEELMSKVWEAYQGDPMDPKNNTEAGLKRVVEVVLENASTPSPESHVRTVANGAPERIWAYSHTGSEWRDGQFRPYDCSSMFGEVQEYVRADLLQHLQKQRSRARTRFNPDGTYDFIDDDPLPQTREGW